MVGIVRLRAAITAAFLFNLVTTHAEAGSLEIAGYLGVNDSLSSDVTLEQNGALLQFEDLDFDGKRWEDAPYWGARVTYWPGADQRWGIGIDLTHATAVSDPDVTGSDFERLEFSDGLNTAIITGYRSFYPQSNIRPYLGLGVGVALPWVEVITAPGVSGPIVSDTFDLQFTGIAAQALAGVKWEVRPRASIFVEYKFGYAMINGDLEEGGAIETDIFNNQAIIGLSYRFGN